MSHPGKRLLATTTFMIVATAPLVFALGGRVAEVRNAGGRVHAAIEISQPFGTTQRTVLERGGTLHVRIEIGVWEDRAVFDRVVEAAHVSAFRVIRNPNGSAIAVVNPGGTLTTYKPYPDRLTVEVDACGLDKLDADGKYYLDGTLTIGTLGEDEVTEANEAVFGRDDDPAGLKRVGKFLLNSVLQVKDYVDSVSTALRSGRFSRNTLRP